MNCRDLDSEHSASLKIDGSRGIYFVFKILQGSPNALTHQDFRRPSACASVAPSSIWRSASIKAGALFPARPFWLFTQ